MDEVVACSEFWGDDDAENRQASCEQEENEEILIGRSVWFVMLVEECHVGFDAAVELFGASCVCGLRPERTSYLPRAEI